MPLRETKHVKSDFDQLMKSPQDIPQAVLDRLPADAKYWGVPIERLFYREVDPEGYPYDLIHFYEKRGKTAHEGKLYLLFYEVPQESEAVPPAPAAVPPSVSEAVPPAPAAVPTSVSEAVPPAPAGAWKWVEPQSEATPDSLDGSIEGAGVGEESEDGDSYFEKADDFDGETDGETDEI